MAGQTAVWGIDLGQCALKAVKLTFDSKADKAIGVAFDYIEHPKILSQPDADPDELIRAALEKFLSRNEVTDSTIYIGVPGQAGLARFVKLPPVTVKKIPEIVNFEARQQIPFPLEDVVWDYQKIGGSGEEEEGLVLETEVGIFAIKRDMVYKHLAPFEAMGIEVNVVQLAPVALYNFAAFDHFYHGSKAEKPAGEGDEEEDEGDALVILDMGADKTDVVVTDGDSIWLRNLPIGGNHFTRALTKEFKLTFAKAEHLKRNATKAPDPKKLYQAMRPVFQDFASELQRSIGYYASTHRQQTVKKVLGVGNGFKLPGIQRFLQQNLQYDVQKVNSYKGLDGEDVVMQPAFAENLPGFCVAYGLALQGLHQTPIQTNLLPREIQARRLVRDKKAWSLAAAAAVLVGCLGLFWGNWRVFSAVNVEDFKSADGAVKNATQQFGAWKGEFDGAKSNFTTKVTEGEDLVGKTLVDQRLAWIEVLKRINAALPPRNPEADTPLEEINEINVEEISAVYAMDLTGWFTKFDAIKLSRMAQEDQAAPPAGPGWIFRIKGHTFHDNGIIYLADMLKARFQTPDMRSAGLTHSVIAAEAIDLEWTPDKSSKADSSKALAPTNGGEGFFDGVREAPVNANIQGRNNTNPGPTGTANVGGQLKTLPPDFTEYLIRSAEQKKNAAPGDEPLTLERTDFIIELVWNPPPPGTVPTDGSQPAEGMPTDTAETAGTP